MTENLSAFRLGDIRGLYPEEIDEDFVHDFAHAFVGQFKLEGQIATGRDMRTSSESLQGVLNETLSAIGIDVIDIGLCPTELGYFASGINGVVRIRRQDQRGFLTIKGPIEGLTRTELEFEIPAKDAETLLSMCHGSLIEKTRHVVFHAGKKWEIDVFEGPNAGLVVAEIELEAEDEAFERPEWLGEEVSSDRRYANSHLSQRPYSEWNH